MLKTMKENPELLKEFDLGASIVSVKKKLMLLVHPETVIKNIYLPLAELN